MRGKRAAPDGTVSRRCMGNRIMVEENFERWKASLRNYDWLTGAVPGATDGDCIIHAGRRSGTGPQDSFLFFEFKAPGETISIGQRIFLSALQKQTNFTVVTVYGPDKDEMYVLGMDWSGRVDKAALRTMTKTWFDMAKGDKAA